jgi:hypothetical protein
MKPYKASNKELLGHLGMDVTRVCVLTPSGEKWVAIGKIDESHVLKINEKTGLPYTMKGEPGQKKNHRHRSMSQTKNFTQQRTVNSSDHPHRKKTEAELDLLYGAVKDNPDNDSIIDYLLVGVAEETAHLRVARKLSDEAGEDSSQLSWKRVQALKALAELLVKKKSDSEAVLNIHSEAFRQSVQFLLKTFREALIDSSLSPEQIQVIFNQLSAKMSEDQWSADLEAVVKKGTG